MEKQQPNEATSVSLKKRNSAGKKTDGKKKKRRKKDTKKREKKRIPRIMTNKEAAHFFPQALIPLVESEYFTTKDLGRLLLRTCKAMTIAGLGEDRNAVWKRLCYSHWGKENGKFLLETAAPMSPETFFCSTFWMDNSKERLQVPRPLQYTPQDYVLIVEMREWESSEKKLVLCKVIPGQALPQLFESEEATIEFEEPLGEMELHGDDCRWCGSLHILRRPDQRMERLMTYKSCTETIGASYNEEGKNKSFVRERLGGQISTLPSALSRSYGYAHALLDHAFHPHDVDSFEVEFKPIYRMSCPNRLGVHGFEFNVYFERSIGEGGYFACSGAIEEKDVTFAHFLEAKMDD